MDSRQMRRRMVPRDAENLTQPIGYLGRDESERKGPAIPTFETPLVTFPADIVIPGSFSGSVELPANCAQIAFISVIPNVVASLNGGGSRTIKDGFVYNGLFRSLQVATDAGGSCIIQVAAFAM